MALRRLVLAFGIVAALIIAAGATLFIWKTREKALEDGQARLSELSLVLAEQTARSISQIDSILVGLAPEIERLAGTPREAAEPILHALLAARAGVPQLQSIVVLDGRGRSFASSEERPMRPADVSDRAYFHAHRERPGAELQLETLPQSRVTGLPGITLSRSVADPRGELAGLVTAFVDVSYFRDLYRSLDLGPEGGVALYRSDGTPVFGAAAADQPQALAAQAWPSAPDQVRVTRLGAPGRERIAAASALPDLPLVIAVQSTPAFVLRKWRNDAWAAGTLGALAAGFVLALAVAINLRLLSDARLRTRVQEGAERLDAVVQSAMDAIITVDADRRIVLFNAAAERIFGCPAAEALGGTLDRFIPERFRAAHRAHVDRFAATGETARRMGTQTALWALRADGTEFPIEASISHAAAGGRELLTVILRDISRRVKAEAEIHEAHERLRELSVAMSEVREAERTRIARELHDELGQALTGLKMDVELLAHTMPAERTDALERIAAMRELLNATVATTRRISADLRPLVLDDLGLAAAAEWLAQNVVERAGLACELAIDPACAELGEPYASALFRIMQESLTNVVRHARARRVEVRLAQADGAAVLAVRDDGVGMDGAARGKPRAFGLRGIHERVMLLEGSVHITSAPGAGTTVVARIPLNGAGRRQAA
ncbi:MAG: PAS domain S-box protein [Burkholderiales bacterium]|nr:PAS domain S-box protein [Burkholderiales bacterium]